MKSLTNLYDQLSLKWTPIFGLIIYASNEETPSHYVEAAQVGENDELINLHPLSLQESTNIGRITMAATGSKDYLMSKGFIPSNVLYLNQSGEGKVVWHTAPQRRRLLFGQELELKNGRANVPGLLWIASADKLRLFALHSANKVASNSPLYIAPFHNVSSNGAVCMGNVDIDARLSDGLEAYMTNWETAFFNSHFTADHGGGGKTKDLHTLYSELIGTDNRFPEEELRKLKQTIKDVL
ncbi:hypothetical protein [Chitinophaga arvensicola]|uniref:PRTRC system protein B n=1 Tax=Chitinophaga arvensicola TaxID=29529 RepID=A0A1I0PQA7_9BACT|nr:hypothetical protein [Chitinophaga arvensicola]SEW16455.1 PRTRC system protein B [Chitinophaga arvensicola]